MTTGGTGTRRTRPNDPSRPERIARAAIAVVAERGLEGLTHRAVAAEADVPLGSTTYHFSTLDALLEVALAHAADDNIRSMRAWENALPPDADLAEAITALIMTWVLEQRASTVVEYELYIAALHRPHLRAISTAWDGALADLFGTRTDPVTGRALAGLFCGLLMQAAVADPPPCRDDVLAVFRRVLGGAPPAG
jgi:DNA-binding transcriptional regulator YbjK